jgi:hypothetical protein
VIGRPWIALIGPSVGCEALHIARATPQSSRAQRCIGVEGVKKFSK